jgi:uncharacterized surface protein with fasciclin (FAS1) repeats
MRSFLRRSSGSALLSIAMTVGAMVPLTTSVPAIAQTTSPTPTPTPSQSVNNFSDVAPDYWARPFIQALAQKNIITGFPNGTFRPEQPVERAEFAAMIANAFEQNQIRPLGDTGFRDVSADYWAVSAIREAFQTGFMQGYGGGLFLPEQPIPRAQALTAIAQGLRLSAKETPANTLRTYYEDAGWIPAYAINPIAAATEANIVVNYPNVRTLSPLKTLTRAEAAALLYQALVQQERVEPLANNVSATNYIAGRNNRVSQNTSTTSTTEVGDIYALSTLNFTTLSSALKAAGLANVLKSEGPYTVFAPTDKAFAALPKETLNKLLQPKNKEILARILRYHVVSGEITANKLSNGELKTLADRAINVKVNRTSNQIAVNDASVVQPNIQASNGIIHAVDEVLLPPNLDLNKLGR